MCLGWRSDSDPCTSLPKAVQSYQNSRQADNYHLSHHQSGIVTSMLRQPNVHLWTSWRSCEKLNKLATRVVNYSQIFCTFAVETTCHAVILLEVWLCIALKFFVLLQSKQRVLLKVVCLNSCELLSHFLYFCSRNNKKRFLKFKRNVVNCSQIFCTFAVETTWFRLYVPLHSCELLSNFLYFCSRNNQRIANCKTTTVVNCSQIFCTFAVETTR